MKTNWIRIRPNEECVICTKKGWCMKSPDGTAVICARVQSDKPVGNKGAGWLHRLQDDWAPPPRRYVRRQPTKPKPDCDLIQTQCVEALSPEALGWLSNDLGISIDAIKQFEVGYHVDRNCYSIPMRRPDGSICGIKYRRHDGEKFCETGSKLGVSVVPGSLVRDHLIIVEGCSDTMAIHDIGFRSVIGRDNCTGNVAQITTLCRRLRPHRIVIIPDNDDHGAGLRGALALRLVLNIAHEVTILELPDDINDVRDCIQTQKNADRLADRIRESISSHTGRAPHE